jgi:hypothetical protein
MIVRAKERITKMHKIVELVIEALSEDYRNDKGSFDEDGFRAFFPEERTEDVTEAWREYSAIQRGEPIADMIAGYAVIS